MAFSVFGILAVIIEALRPLLSFFLIWLVIDLIATALTLRQRRFAHEGPVNGQSGLVLSLLWVPS